MSDWEHAIRSELRNYRGINNTSEFTLDEFQDFSRDRFDAQFPHNNTVDASVRRNLQELLKQIVNPVAALLNHPLRFRLPGWCFGYESDSDDPV